MWWHMPVIPVREVEAEDQKFKIIISYIKKKKSLGIAWHGEAYL